MLQTEPIQRIEPIQEEGILFVRTNDILETMAKAPLFLAGLVMISIVLPIQSSFASTKSLDLIIYQDGTTHVSTQLDVDPLDPDYTFTLFGPDIDNFVATGENGLLLSAKINGTNVTIDTFDSSKISIDYDIHDLVSKEGRIWTFVLDSDTDYNVLMPKNTVIVGMTNLPINMETINDQNKIHLPAGSSEINYVFPIPVVTPEPTPKDNTKIQPIDDNTFLIVGLVAAVAGVSAFVLKKLRKPSYRKTSSSSSTEPILIKNLDETNEKPTDVDEYLEKISDLREDDKAIVKFISENGGQVLESDLRKKFLQPRTTMWRAVKRLERLGLIEIEKKDLQNLVKLKKEVDDEE